MTRLENSPPTNYRARWIAPGAKSLIRDGVLAVQSGRIIAVGSAADLLSDGPGVANCVDLGDVLVTPGFVNAHAHLELTGYRGMLPRGPLQPWIEKLIELRRLPGADAIEREAVRVGVAESLAAGVTCIGDISRTGMSAEVLSESPIRKVCFIELISGARNTPNDVRSLVRCFDELQPFVRERRLICGISPHAPGTVTAADMAGALELAAHRCAPVTIHYLETREERSTVESARFTVINAHLLSRIDSRRTPASASDHQVPAMVLAHVNYATDGDIQRIARGGASVVWCPRAHAYYGHRNHRWREMRAAGINVCVGTDSAVCVDSLSMLDELREIKRRYPAESAADLLRLATINAANALGLGHEIGQLTPGFHADFVVHHIENDAQSDPLDGVLSPGSAVESVFIGGRSVISH